MVSKGKVFERFKEIEQIKVDKDNGRIMCIPFSNYPKLASCVPGILPATQYIITAGSGIGKTQVAKALFVREPLEYCKANNIKLKIFYFALEESKEEFIDSMIANYMSSKGVRLDVLTLQGFRTNSLSNDEMNAIKPHIKDIEDLLSNIEIIDSIYNATGIYKFLRDYADKNGNHIYEDRDFIKKKSDGTTITEKTKVYSHYVPNDPNQFVIVVVDHISLLAPEKDSSGKIMTLHQCMAKLSSDYFLKQVTKHWGWSTCLVQQQETSSAAEQFTNKGDSVIKKTEPSIPGLANNKEIARDAKVILGVYSPDRFSIEEYHGYDIKRMRDTFRGIQVLKNRFGQPNRYVHFLFDGATNNFKELPSANESAKMIPYYEKADRLLGRTGTPLKTMGKISGFGV